MTLDQGYFSRLKWWWPLTSVQWLHGYEQADICAMTAQIWAMTADICAMTARIWVMTTDIYAKTAYRSAMTARTNTKSRRMSSEVLYLGSRKPRNVLRMNLQVELLVYIGLKSRLVQGSGMFHEQVTIGPWPGHDWSMTQPNDPHDS